MSNIIIKKVPNHSQESSFTAEGITVLLNEAKPYVAILKTKSHLSTIVRKLDLIPPEQKIQLAQTKKTLQNKKKKL